MSSPLTLCGRQWNFLLLSEASLAYKNLCPILPEHTTDLGFPRSALLSSSCQYTMVPLGGLPGHRANGQPYFSGINGQACANGIHVSRGCPVAAVGCPGVKSQQHCPGELLQVMCFWGSWRGRCGTRKEQWSCLLGLLPSAPIPVCWANFSQQQLILLNSELLESSLNP
jgi:hypothetical protein